MLELHTHGWVKKCHHFLHNYVKCSIIKRGKLETPADVHKIIGRRIVNPFGPFNYNTMVLTVGLQRFENINE